jgi:hypothetical protein
MRGLPDVEVGPTTRTRRWDAVILGGALPGLVAAARLGLRGARVLVLEEESAARREPSLREPFFLGGVQKDGVLGACLRGLRVPLIDQRRIEPGPLAFQVVLPDARVDVGEPALTIDEWVAWGLAKPEEARGLTAALRDAAAAEREAMLEAPVVRSARRLPLSGRRAPSDVTPERTGTRGAPPERGLPPQLAALPPRLTAVLGAWTRALSNLGATAPSDPARARLLGAPFEGSAMLRGDDTLRGILQRRIESLYGEFRTLSGPFRLVASGGQPGVAPDASGDSGEVWVSRALLLNAGRDALAAAVAQDPAPEPLRTPPATRRRISLRFRVKRSAVPEGMASRVILLGDPDLPPEGTNLVTLRQFSPTAARESVEIVACAVIAADEPDPAARASEIEAGLRALMPFAGNRIERIATPEPRWDDDARLGDPTPGAGWPEETELRLSTKQPIYALDRAAVAGLGFEGDLLLGWRAGDAVAADLA